MNIHWLLKGSCWPINILLFVSTLGNVRLKSFSLNKPVKFEYKRRLCISLFHTSVDFGNENVRKSTIYGIGVATISGPHKHVFGLCCTCLCFFHIVSPVSVVLIVCFWTRIVLFYFHLSPLTYTPWYGVHLSPLTYTPWYGACMSSFYFSGLCYCILFVAYYVSYTLFDLLCHLMLLTFTISKSMRGSFMSCSLDQMLTLWTNVYICPWNS